MKTYRLYREQFIPRPITEVFDFFSRAENLQDITPGWLHFRILTPLPIEMKQGATIQYALRLRGLPIRWLTEIKEWNPPHSFVDQQIRGPYTLWHHTHRFAEAEGGTRMEDIVDYAIPYGILGRIMHALQVKTDLAKIFDYRAERIRQRLG